jgi:hypothetical protein
MGQRALEGKDTADRASSQDLGGPTQGGVEAHVVVDHQDPAFGPRRPDHGRGFPKVESHRFLDEDVDPGAEGRQGRRRMEMIGKAYGDSIDEA